MTELSVRIQDVRKLLQLVVAQKEALATYHQQQLLVLAEQHSEQILLMRHRFESGDCSIAEESQQQLLLGLDESYHQQAEQHTQALQRLQQKVLLAQSACVQVSTVHNRQIETLSAHNASLSGKLSDRSSQLNQLVSQVDVLQTQLEHLQHKFASHQRRLGDRAGPLPVTCLSEGGVPRSCGAEQPASTTGPSTVLLTPNPLYEEAAWAGKQDTGASASPSRAARPSVLVVPGPDLPVSAASFYSPARSSAFHTAAFNSPASVSTSPASCPPQPGQAASPFASSTATHTCLAAALCAPVCSEAQEISHGGAVPISAVDTLSGAPPFTVTANNVAAESSSWDGFHTESPIALATQRPPNEQATIPAPQSKDAVDVPLPAVSVTQAAPKLSGALFDADSKHTSPARSGPPSPSLTALAAARAAQQRVLLRQRAQQSSPQVNSPRAARKVAADAAGSPAAQLPMFHAVTAHDEAIPSMLPDVSQMTDEEVLQHSRAIRRHIMAQVSYLTQFLQDVRHTSTATSRRSWDAQAAQSQATDQPGATAPVSSDVGSALSRLQQEVNALQLLSGASPSPPATPAPATPTKHSPRPTQDQSGGRRSGVSRWGTSPSKPPTAAASTPRCNSSSLAECDVMDSPGRSQDHSTRAGARAAAVGLSAAKLPGCLPSPDMAAQVAALQAHVAQLSAQHEWVTQQLQQRQHLSSLAQAAVDEGWEVADDQLHVPGTVRSTTLPLHSTGCGAKPAAGAQPASPARVWVPGPSGRWQPSSPSARPTASPRAQPTTCTIKVAGKHVTPPRRQQAGQVGGGSSYEQTLHISVALNSSPQR
ncbi:hypothetical protein V8C86DRAFT_2943251 [Haematococcus lacustris]